MDLPFRDRLPSVFGGGAADSDGEAESSTLDTTVVVDGDQAVRVDLPERVDLDAEALAAELEATAAPTSGTGRVRGAAGGDSTTIPVASGGDLDLVDGAFDLGDYDIGTLDDPTIRNLQERSVDYDSDVAEWIVAHDDLVPGVIQRLKGILLGESGLSVAPADADDEADQRLAEHMRGIYQGQSDLEAHVKPAQVVGSVLAQNAMFGVWVGRSTDLERLDIDSLNYIKDGATGEEVYVQNRVGYVTIDVDEDTDDVDAEYEETGGERALRVGEEVLDVQLYRTPPLLAVADDVVNKLQIKRLKARKAEIASIGGLYIKIEPPEWLDEAEYQDRTPADEHPYGDEPMKRLEVVLRQDMEAALDTLESYQTATVMSIPDHWTVETIELPEMETSMDDQIRGYNEAIGRRLLLPLDLMELEQGSELSRDSMLAIVLDTLAGWQRELVDLFDDFAAIQKEIHGLNGSVEHSLPSLSTEDEAQIVKLLNFAGLLGLSEAEARELVNGLEGVDLIAEDLSDAPPAGMPEDQDEPPAPPGMNNGQPAEAGDVEAEHAFSGFDSVREAAQHVREVVARQLGAGETVTMRQTEHGYQLMIHDDAGDFLGSMTIRRSELQDDEFVVTGTREFFDPLRAASATTSRLEAFDALEHVAAAEADQDAIDEAHEAFTGLVNMSASELRDWAEHPCSDQASQDPEAVRERVLDVLETPKDEWTQRTVAKARKIAGFIERMSADENRPDGDINDGAHGCPTDWVIALLNWGHRPDGVELPVASEVDI